MYEVFKAARYKPPTVLATIALLFVYLAPIPLAGISLVASVMLTPAEETSSPVPAPSVGVPSED